MNRVVSLRNLACFGLLLGMALVGAGRTEAAVRPDASPTGIQWRQMTRELEALKRQVHHVGPTSGDKYRAAQIYRQMAGVFQRAERMFASAAASSNEPSHVPWFRYMSNGSRIAAAGCLRNAQFFQDMGDQLRRRGQ